MARFDALIAEINANVKSNGNQEITGSVMNTTLKDIVEGVSKELDIAISTSYNKANIPANHKATYYIMRVGQLVSYDVARDSMARVPYQSIKEGDVIFLKSSSPDKNFNVAAVADSSGRVLLLYNTTYADKMVATIAPANAARLYVNCWLDYDQFYIAINPPIISDIYKLLVNSGVVVNAIASE